VEGKKMELRKRPNDRRKGMRSWRGKEVGR
jgi:hypothetical protein